MLWLDKLSTTLTDFVNWIAWEWKEILDPKEAKEIDEKYAKERQDLLWEVAESAVARWLPWRWKVADLFTSLWIKEWDPEVVRRQKEFESITARTMFVPDFLLKNVTNPITQIPWFQILLKNYPIGGKTKDRLLDESWNLVSTPDPDDVINFLRLVNQDLITGKIVVWKVL